MRKLKFIDWGVKDYNQAWKEQEVLFNQILNAKLNKEGDKQFDKHFIVFVEHPHVYTLGKSGSENNLLINAIQLQAEDATFVNTNRGGDITYHGPGQIVGYPILDIEELKMGLKDYIFHLEEAIINSLAVYGLKGERLDGATGVWLDTKTPKARKICAIGVKSSRYVTMHGFALNVNTNLKYFNYINPCGFVDKGVTSLNKELNCEIDFNDAKKVVKQELLKMFA